MLSIIISFTIITLIVATVITIIQKIFAVKEDPIVEKIDKLLPQTQCGQCGYPGCMPYAQAVANGEMINKCTPGGQETVVKLAELLNREIPSGEMEEPEDLVAIIEEEKCIGCVKCIEACPVDAIIGAKSLMHVIVADYCTGCKLCVEPCPVKCIHMIDRKKELNKFEILRAESNFPKGVTPESLLKVVNIPDEKHHFTASSLQIPKQKPTLKQEKSPLFAQTLATKTEDRASSAANSALANSTLANAQLAQSKKNVKEEEKATFSSSAREKVKNASSERKNTPEQTNSSFSSTLVLNNLKTDNLNAENLQGQIKSPSSYSSALVAKLAAKLAKEENNQQATK